MKRISLWAGPAAGVALALWLTLPVLGSRPPAGEDTWAHLVRADFGISELVAEGRLDGWFWRFALGHQEFLFNGPGLVWAMAAVRAVTFGALSNPGALKVVAVASFAAVPLAMWFLARSFGLRQRAAGLVAVLSLLVSGPYGPGLDGTFRVGLASHQLGAVFFLVALGAGLRMVRAPAARWIAVASVSLAALLVTHLISVLILAVMAALTAVGLTCAGRLSWPAAVRLAVAGIGAAGVAGFWLVPAVAHRDLRGFVTTWGTPPITERLRRIAEGDYLLPAGLALVLGAAAVWGVVSRRHRRRLWVPALLAPAYLLVAHGSLELLGGNEVTLQLANRGLGYAGLVALLPLAAVVSAWLRRAGTRGHLVGLAAAAVAVVAFAPGRGAAGEMPEPAPEMLKASAQLARLVPDGARFATQRNFPGEVHRTGVVHPELWLAWASGRNSLNGFNLESSSTPRAALEPARLDDRSPVASSRALARLGVTHVVTTGTKLATELAASGHFRLTWRAPPLAILAVLPRPGFPDPASQVHTLVPADATLVDATPERMRLRVSTERPLTATVALAWSPKWHATVDGEPAALEHTGDGLVRLELGGGEHDIVLEYRSDGWDRAGPALTGLSVAAGLAWWGARRRPRQLMSRIFSRTA
ncbi:MAG: hypothetical protein ACRDY7_09235 [Acidimicrobiia bacterium]